MKCGHMLGEGGKPRPVDDVIDRPRLRIFGVSLGIIDRPRLSMISKLSL